MTERTERRPLTAEDIEFLSKLGDDMRTGENMGQRFPRYWVIRDFGYRPVAGDWEQVDRIWYDDCYYEPEEIARLCYGEIMREHSIYPDAEEEYPLTWKLAEIGIKVGENKVASPGPCFDVRAATEIAFGIGECDDVQPMFLTMYMQLSDGPLFLTLEDARKYLEENAHHHHPEASTYALTAWCSPRVKRLFEILENVDFGSLSPASNADQ